MQTNIEEIKKLSGKEKFVLKAKNFLMTHAFAYGVSALAGVGVGVMTQKIERDITGYDPIIHEKIKEGIKNPSSADFDQFKKDKLEQEKKGIKSWFSETYKKLKNGVLHPKEFIQSTDTYRTIQLQYLSALSFIDDVSFFAPALLMFIMLGGYVVRKLEAMQGDIVLKKENEMVITKINELVGVANILLDRIHREGAEVLTQEEVNQVRELLSIGRESFPEDYN